jgi:RNA 2',3'-cyclic 3'-phosphodiesterase
MRLFAALPLPRNAATAITEGVVHAREAYPLLNWVKPESMHLTIHFFGDMPDACVEFLMKVFDDPTLRRAPIPARLGLPGQFPKKGPPNVLWMGLDKGTEEMRSYWDLFESKIVPLHLEPDPRGFQPHVTIARTGKNPMDSRWVDHVAVPPLEFEITELVLFQSMLGRTGAVYVPLKRVSFERGSA